MIEKLIPFKLPPGMYHNGTRYDAKGRWYDGNWVRWREGQLQAMGLFRRARQTASSSDQAGIGALLFGRILSLQTANGPRIVAAVVKTGSVVGLFAFDPSGSGTTWSDITPVGLTASAQWTLDVFGNLLLAQHAGQIYTWDGVLANKAVEITGDPFGLAGAFTTPERFLVALAPGATTDYTKVQWADQETSSVWTPTPTNAAGDINLATRGRLVGGAAAKGQSLIWTNLDVWSMTYIGGSLIYSFRQEGTGCGLIGPNASVAADGRMFWMGLNGFYVYDGFVRQLRCDVHDKIFGAGGLNRDLGSGSIFNPVTTMHMSLAGEVWWYYPNGTATTNNSYVVYNYREDIWYFGSIDRIAGYDAGVSVLGVTSTPLMLDATNGFLFEHEQNSTFTGTGHSGVSAYAESGPVEIGDGDRLMSIQRIEPDGVNLTDVQLTIFSAMDPVSSETTNGPYSLANPTDVRVKARQVRLKVSEATANTSWRLGTPRFGVIPSSRR